MPGAFESDVGKPMSEIEPMPPAPTEVASDEPAALATANERLENTSAWRQRLRRLARTAGKAAIASAVVLAPPAAVLAPVAAAIDAAVIAPGASVPGTIAGAHVTSKLDFTSGNIRSSFPFDVKPYQKSNIVPGPKQIGANVNFDYNNTDLTVANGNYDMQKILTIFRDFSNNHSEIQAIASATEEYYGKVALGSFTGVLLAECLIKLYKYRRQKELNGLSPEVRETARADRRFPRIVGGTALAAVAGGLIIPAGIALAQPSYTAPPRPDKKLAGLGFKNISINQAGQRIVDALIGTGQNYLKSVDQYYSLLAGTFTKNFNLTYGTKSLEPEPGTLTVIAADDFQGQDGPAGIVGLAAKMFNANMIVVGGDTTGTGTGLETSELSALRDKSGNIPIYISRGHHDPDLDTLHQMAKAFKNIYVADGKAHVIDGISIAGTNAPDIIKFGSAKDNVINPDFKGATPDQANQLLTKQLLKTVCQSKKPLIVEMHDDSVGTPLAKAGCSKVKIVLDGREYVPKTPTSYGPTTEFTSGSTGGHSAYEPPLQLFSKITAPATFRQITIDAKTYEPISSTLVTLYPSGQVTFTNEVIQKGASESPSATSSSLAAPSARLQSHLQVLLRRHKSQPTGPALPPAPHQPMLTRDR